MHITWTGFKSDTAGTMRHAASAFPKEEILGQRLVGGNHAHQPRLLTERDTVAS